MKTLTLNKVLEAVVMGVLDSKDIAEDFLRWSDNDTLRDIYNFYWETDITRSEEDTERMMEDFYNGIEFDSSGWIIRFGKWVGNDEFTDYIDYYLRVRDYPELDELI